jgi:glutathione S-transferase
MLKLLVGNKNYSSWSLRPWILLRYFEIPFDEQYVSLNDPDFATVVGKYSGALRVPVLVDDGFAVWDSIAICEYVAERHPELAIWPHDRRNRAQARSISAEMHSGFNAFRAHWPMNIRASLPGHPPEEGPVARDFERICAIWTTALERSRGPFLFGEFCAADAMYAPVASRFATYHATLSPTLLAYRDRLLATDAMQEWTSAALAESEILADDEPYGAPAGRP